MSDVLHRVNDPSLWRTVLDVTSIGTVIATIVGWFPHIASFLTIVWMGIRVYETDTVQRWLRRRKKEPK